MMYEIPADVEQLIKVQMASGKYHSPEELLRDALQTLALHRGAGNLTSQDNPSGSALDALASRGLVGCIESGHTDLSVNPSHMKGFGENGS